MQARIELGQLNRQEARRYMGHGGAEPDDRLLALIEQCEREVLDAAQPRFVYRVCEIENESSGVAVKGTNLVLTGNSIREHLSGCERAVLMAVTVSAGIDRLIRIAQLEDMAKAVVIDSLASVAVEQACDRAEEIIRTENPGYYQTFRFGLGYGDLPVSLQGAFLNVLNAPKQIGLNVSASDMLTPTKSVTAVIGLSREPVSAKARGCQTCSMRDTCKFRQKGGRCNG